MQAIPTMVKQTREKSAKLTPGRKRWGGGKSSATWVTWLRGPSRVARQRDGAAQQPPSAEQRHDAARRQAGEQHTERGGRGAQAGETSPARLEERGEQRGERQRGGGGLRQVAHGGGDGDAADRPGGEPDGGEREEQAKAEGDDEALRLDGDAEREADAGDGRPDECDDQRAERQPSDDARGGGQEVVDGALEEQHAHDVGAAHA